MKKFIDTYLDIPVYDATIEVVYTMDYISCEYSYTASIVSSKQDDGLDDKLANNTHSKVSFTSLDEFRKILSQNDILHFSVTTLK